MHYNNWNEGVGGLGTELTDVEHPSEEKFFEHCTNCAIIPRPLSHDHFCENLASLLFHSSAGERLQIYSQIHLKYFSEYLLVKRRTIQSATCKLCHETLSEHYHEILHCRVLFKVLDHFMPLVLGFHSRNLSDEELKN